GNLGLGKVGLFVEEEGLDARKQVALALERVLIFQLRGHFIEDRHGPTSLEKLFRIEALDRFVAIAILRDFRIEFDKPRLPAALESVFFLPVVGDEVLERTEQKGTKASALRDYVFE